VLEPFHVSREPVWTRIELSAIAVLVGPPQRQPVEGDAVDPVVVGDAQGQSATHSFG
jgi:hypothetical protein